MSASGQKILWANKDGGPAWLSLDYGVTWSKTRVLPGESLGAAFETSAISADGTHMYLGQAGLYGAGDMLVSVNNGATWSSLQPQGYAGNGVYTGNESWNQMSSSSDGSKLVARSQSNSNNPGGLITVSSDSGVTWTTVTSLGTAQWVTAMSANGQVIAAVSYASNGTPGYIYLSTDGGATWTQQTSAGTGVWYSIALSSDGSKLIAVNVLGAVRLGGGWTILTATL